MKYKSLIVCDLDNTLMDTGNYLKSTHCVFLKKLKLFPPFYKNIIKVVQSIRKDSDLTFISHRNIFLYPISLIQIKLMGFFKFKLIHVDSVPKKTEYLKKYIMEYEDIHYFDDLSYNHENKVILFYDDVINDLNRLNIKYYGYDWIEKNK